MKERSLMGTYVADHQFQSDRKMITNMKQTTMKQTIKITLIMIENLRKPIVVNDPDIGIQTILSTLSILYSQIISNIDRIPKYIIIIGLMQMRVSRLVYQ